MVQRSTSVIGITLGAAMPVASPGPAAAQDKIVSVSTLDWPPYTGSELPRGGATTEAVRAAFAKVGYEINVAYRPWKRASTWPRREPTASSRIFLATIATIAKASSRRSRSATGRSGSPSMSTRQ